MGKPVNVYIIPRILNVLFECFTMAIVHRYCTIVDCIIVYFFYFFPVVKVGLFY